MIFFRISVCSMLIAISTMPQLAQADCGNSVADLGEINSSAAGHYAMENAKEYPNSGWLNVLKYNVFMANNRAETIQARISLSNVNKKMQCRLKYIDLVHDQPVDWENLTTDSFENEVKKFHSIAAILTDNLTNPAAPLFVTFSSASHNLLSAVTITVPSDLNSAGFVPVMMEYPGYGASMGRPSRENFQNAAVGLVKYLSKKYPHRSILFWVILLAVQWRWKREQQFHSLLRE